MLSTAAHSRGASTPRTSPARTRCSSTSSTASSTSRISSGRQERAPSRTGPGSREHVIRRVNASHSTVRPGRHGNGAGTAWPRMGPGRGGRARLTPPANCASASAIDAAGSIPSTGAVGIPSTPVLPSAGVSACRAPGLSAGSVLLPTAISDPGRPGRAAVSARARRPRNADSRRERRLRTREDGRRAPPAREVALP